MIEQNTVSICSILFSERTEIIVRHRRRLFVSCFFQISMPLEHRTPVAKSYPTSSVHTSRCKKSQRIVPRFPRTLSVIIVSFPTDPVTAAIRLHNYSCDYHMFKFCHCIPCLLFEHFEKKKKSEIVDEIHLSVLCSTGATTNVRNRPAFRKSAFLGTFFRATKRSRNGARFVQVSRTETSVRKSQ